MKRLLCWTSVFLLCLGCRGDEETQDESASTAITSTTESVADESLEETTSRDETSAVLAALLDLVETGRWNEKAAAIRRIGMLGAGGESAVPILRERINDSGEYWLVRCEAVYALAEIGPQNLADVGAALSDGPPRLRWTAAFALGKIDAPPDQVVTLLQKGLQDRDWLVRSEAAHSLAGKGELAVPVLREALRDQDARVQSAAVWAIGRLGEAAKTTMPDLRARLSDNNWLVRSEAVYALGRMGDEALPDILSQLESPEWAVQSAAVQALREMGRSDLAPREPEFPQPRAEPL